jgi:hypothetical protein
MSDTALPGGPAAENPPHHDPKHRREGVPLDGAPDLGLYASPGTPASGPTIDFEEFGENPDTETAG